MRKLSEKHIGMVDLPLLSVPSLKQQMVRHRSANTTLEQLEALSAEQKAKRGPRWFRIRSPAITMRRWLPILFIWSKS
ncbi:hypothetical protein ACLK2E_09400 [Escherichia coli]